MFLPVSQISCLELSGHPVMLGAGTRRGSPREGVSGKGSDRGPAARSSCTKTSDRSQPGATVRQGTAPPPASQATAKWGFCLLRPKAIVSGTVAVLVIQMMAGRSHEDMLVPGTLSCASLTWNPAPGRARGRLTKATRPDGTAREDGSHKRQ